MKKAILTFGLFSMIMVLTSFTTPSEIGGNSAPKTGTGPDQGTGGYTTEIGGNSTPKSGVSFTDIGGNSAPKTGDTGTGIAIGGNSTPRTGTDPNTGTGGITDIGGSSVPKSGTGTQA